VTVRQRKNFAHAFKMPQPYNPMEGVYADIQTKGVFPYCAMMQVAADDDKADYVICRGFDVRIGKFINYVDGDTTNNPGIPVAKPYGLRSAGVYKVGQMFPAVLPLQSGGPSPNDADIRFGQNPGVAAETVGHPADLDEDVGILTTTAGVKVNWMLLSSMNAARMWRFTLNADINAGTAAADKLELDGSDTGEDITVTDLCGRYGGLKDTCYGICLQQIDQDGATKYVIIDEPLKQFCRFTLTQALATSDASKTGDIETQFGQGQDHPDEEEIILYNLADNTGTAYVFEGDIGDAGIAVYTGTAVYWNIIQMECP